MCSGVYCIDSAWETNKRNEKGLFVVLSVSSVPICPYIIVYIDHFNTCLSRLMPGILDKKKSVITFTVLSVLSSLPL